MRLERQSFNVMKLIEFDLRMLTLPVQTQLKKANEREAISLLPYSFECRAAF